MLAICASIKGLPLGILGKILTHYLKTVNYIKFNFRSHKNNMHVKKTIVQTQCTQCDQMFNKKCNFYLIKRFTVALPNFGLLSLSEIGYSYYILIKYGRILNEIFHVFAASMQRHFKIVHLQLKPYKCKYCDQSFGKKMTLDHHQMRHTGEKAHFCPFCGKGFIQKVALKTHIKTHDKVKDIGGI